jgi:hypothetical protein
LTGYEVDGVGEVIVLHTEPFSGGGDAFVDVIFDGVAAYEFENDLLRNIVFDVEESSVTETQEIANRLQATEGRWGFPRDWDPRRETVLECFNRLNVKVFQLGSSYGMTGWVAARTMSKIMSFTPAHLPKPVPAEHDAIREVLAGPGDIAQQLGDANAYDRYIPGIHRVLKSGVKARQIADYLALLYTEAMRIPTTAEALEGVADRLIALRLAPER